MAYTGLLMDNLRKLIHGNHDPVISNNPMTLSKRSQFQLLYQELDSIIQTLSNIHQHHHPHQHHKHKKVRDLKKRLKDVAEEAQDIIDLYLSSITVDFSDRELSPRSDVSETSLNLENIMRSIKSIKVELTTINIDNMKMDSSPRSTSTSSTRSISRKRKPPEEIVVGLELDVEIIRDKLVEDTKQLGVVSIVGMGGLGKTTLAIKVFNDRFVVYHFHVRAWVTISQSYKRRDLLIQILTSIGVQQDLEKDNDPKLREKVYKKLMGIQQDLEEDNDSKLREQVYKKLLGVQQDLEKDTDSKLREKVYKKLMGRRYLIVIDDIWNIEAWEELKMFFPHDNTASRILLTTRLNEVALHMKPHGFVHSLPYLTEEESWELLKQKVFHGDDCPERLITTGRKIAIKCQGLPLSVVLMAGVLEKKPMSQDLWEEIACSIGSYHKGNLETLALSYHHLPDHLRDCFLYLGGFPEGFMFTVQRLIWLWIAEGFIEEVGDRSLEDIAKAYLIDLINRNLVIVAERKFNGDVKACKLHDLVKELCVQKAEEERFFLKIDPLSLSSQLHPSILYQQRRIFTNYNINIVDDIRFPTQTIRSLLCFHVNIYSIKSIAQSYLLLRVLDLQKCLVDDFHHGLALPVHLRYLAIWYSYKFPHSICKLWSLQTLILKRRSGDVHLPHNIADLVNLRHLWSDKMLRLPYTGKPMNLQSISNVEIDGVDSFQKCFPNIKKLAFSCGKGNEYHFDLLPYLEILKLMRPVFRQNQISLTATLKKLTLVTYSLPWSDMSIIESLPNLEVLKLKGTAFMGPNWDACEQQFPQLKLLMLSNLYIKQWEASSTSFPSLKKLSLWKCKYLEEVPLEIGEIATLELIETDSSSNSVVESVKKIQQEQHNEGNYELKITVDEMELSFYLSQCEGSKPE